MSHVRSSCGTDTKTTTERRLSERLLVEFVPVSREGSIRTFEMAHLRYAMPSLAHGHRPVLLRLR